MKGYLVLDVSIHDFSAFKAYIEKIPAYLHRHGGRYVVQGVVPERVEGDWCPERLVIIEFPSTEAARRFLADPEVQPLFAIRHASTTSKLVLAEGC